MRLASNGIFSFSTFGLKLPFYFGAGIVVIVLFYFLTVGVLLILGKTDLVTGWLSLAALLILSLGVQLFFLGMFGLYLGKIFLEVKQRPCYFVKRSVGFKE